MKTILIKVFSFLFFLLVVFDLIAQPACPSVSVTPSNASVTCGGCTTLTATVQGTVATTSYSVSPITYNPFPYSGGTIVLNGTDDQWCPDVINLPFCFSYFGNTYTQGLIGANGQFTFDLSQNGTPCFGSNPYTISGPLPLLGGCNGLNYSDSPGNTICAAFRDIDLSISGSTGYYITGTAPCRALVIYWNDVALFSDGMGTCDNTPNSTFQIVLSENTNYIDVYIQNSYSCDEWNEGYGIIGIQNQNATVAVCPPNRNYPNKWTANNEAWRFTPTGAPQYNLTWYEPPNTPIGTGLTVTVCPTVTTTYTATVVNTTCASPITVSSVATVTTGGNLPISFTPALCNSSSGTATANSGGTPPFTYSWSTTPPQNTQTATGLAPGTYTATVVDSLGCPATGTVTITSAGGLSATTTSTETDCLSNIGTATAAPTSGTAPYTYLWNNGQATQTATGLGAGNYSVTITDSNGCSGSAVATVTTTAGITSVTTNSTQTSCPGGNDGTATAIPSGGRPPYTYLWNNSQTTQNATGLVSGNYTITVIDANGCTFPTTVSVTASQPMSFSSVVAADTCKKETGAATAVISGGTTPYTYLWLTSPTQSTAGVTGLAQGTYTCIITDAKGCAIASSVSVGNIPGPNANFTASPPVVNIINPDVYFINLSSSDVTSWLWNFGDSTPNSTVQNPNHLYQNEGTFTITLIVINASGCPDTIQQTILVEGHSTFYVPNTFTPNYDGKNDVFAPVFTKISSEGFSILIFDRWGNEIFKTETIGEYWDGKMKGETVQEDVYVYVITYQDIKKAGHKLIGNVNVIK